MDSIIRASIHYNDSVTFIIWLQNTKCQKHSKFERLNCQMQLMYMSAWEVSPPRCLKTVICTHCKNGTCQLCGFTHLFYANIFSFCYKFLNTELFTGLLAPSKFNPQAGGQPPVTCPQRTTQCIFSNPLLQELVICLQPKYISWHNYNRHT